MLSSHLSRCWLVPSVQYIVMMTCSLPGLLLDLLNLLFEFACQIIASILHSNRSFRHYSFTAKENTFLHGCSHCSSFLWHSKERMESNVGALNYWSPSALLQSLLSPFSGHLPAPVTNLKHKNWRSTVDCEQGAAGPFCLRPVPIPGSHCESKSEQKAMYQRLTHHV